MPSLSKCNHASNKTNFICCNRSYCNNLPVAKFKLNLRENLYFFVFFLLLVVFIVLAVLLIKKCCKQSAKKKDIEHGPQQQAGKPKLKDQLEYVRSIRKGKFTESFFGCRMGEKLFIKQFHKKAKQNWLNEVEVYGLPLLRHENIVDFVGKDHLLIATIYYENGSLTNFLAKNRRLDETQLIELMLSAALGLNHLHQDLEFKPPVAHRKLDSDNFIVAVSPELKCKLTNFSEALTYTRYEKLEKEHNLRQLKSIVCDPKYCPPEYFNQTINPKSFLAFLNADIYSFSLILWQIANHLEDRAPQESASVTRQTSAATSVAASAAGTVSTYAASKPSLEGSGQQDEDQVNDENRVEDENRAESGNRTESENPGNQSDQNDLPEFRYSKPFEEYFCGDGKSEFEQMKELLKDECSENSLINRPTIYFDASKVRTFNGYVITKLIEECWSPDSGSRLSIVRIVKELGDLYKTQMVNKSNLP